MHRKPTPEDACRPQGAAHARALIDATLAIILEQGLSAATAQGTAPAGVTWGAAQHHFGSKANIFETILASAYARYIDAMGEPALRRGSRTQRTRRLSRAVVALPERLLSGLTGDLTRDAAPPAPRLGATPRSRSSAGGA
jgi:AcrR family transcriptional regulator